MTRDAKSALFVPATWISRRSSSAAVVRRKFAWLLPVVAMLDAMQPGDELRWYCSPRAGWAQRMGVRGYLVLRDGEIVARSVTART